MRQNLDENQIGTLIIAAAIEVHRELGPGLLESIYEQALVMELAAKGLEVATQVPIPVHYKGRSLDVGFRADIVVEGKVLVELKSVEALLPVHKKQANTYVRVLGFRLGYLLNFGALLMKEGIVRIVNGLPDSAV